MSSILDLGQHYGKVKTYLLIDRNDPNFRDAIRPVLNWMKRRDLYNEYFIHQSGSPVNASLTITAFFKVQRHH